MTSPITLPLLEEGFGRRPMRVKLGNPYRMDFLVDPWAPSQYLKAIPPQSMLAVVKKQSAAMSPLVMEYGRVRMQAKPGHELAWIKADLFRAFAFIQAIPM